MDRTRLISDKFGLTRKWVCPACKHKEAVSRRNSFSTLRIASTVNRCFSPKPRNVAFRSGTRRHLSNAQSWRAAQPRQPILPDGPARTRFAPSPTGYLHIGGLRTALFSYLLAKRTGGQFLLRIEDTDQKRFVPDAESQLCNNLRWAGLDWDEGPGVGGPHGPYRQSERSQIYLDYSRKLLDHGSAYRCFCTPQSHDSAKVTYVTSGCYQNCSSLTAEESQSRAEDKHEAFTVRLRPVESKRIYKDLVYGKLQRLKRLSGALQDDAVADSSDTILMKSEGTPTYHFANVVDDHLMNITHVIRGSEWMASTPLHYDLYAAFGWEPPQFAHVGLLVDANEAKLSKRKRDALNLSGQGQELPSDVSDLRDRFGILPDALDNFLALLGWSNPTDNDVMDMDALIRNFDLKFTRGNAMVRVEKLNFLQKQHAALRCEKAEETKSFAPVQDIVSRIVNQVRGEFADPFMNAELFSEVYYSEAAEVPDPLAAYCTEILLADSKSYQNAAQFVERNRYFFAFDPSLVPTQSNSDKGLAEDGPALFAVASAVLHFAERAQDHANPSELSNVQQLDHVFHESFWHTLWTFAVIQCSGKESASTSQAIDSRLDVQSQANALIGVGSAELKSLNGEAGIVDRLVSCYKTLNKALMKYFRDHLAYGQPGPSMSIVMALLGHDECARRMPNSLRAESNGALLDESRAVSHAADEETLASLERRFAGTA